MPYIKPEFKDRLIESADIYQVISRYVNLEKKGVNYFCRSPLTDERTASMVVSPAKQRFTDYSANKSGNVITFLMEYQKLDYVQALETLAEIMNTPVEYEEISPERVKIIKEKKDRTEEMLRVAISSNRKFQDALYAELKNKNSDASKELAKRNYDEQVIVDWQIGFAPGERFIYNLCKENGVKKPAQDIGLIGDKFDKLWNRLTYPIHNKRGKLVGFASRDLSGNEESAKWMNPTSSDLYDKSKIWFGLNHALHPIIQKKEAWIVEGYNDVISLHQNGLQNSIASCGTAIHANQIAELKKITEKVIFCMDGDKAGIQSMIKYIPQFFIAGFSVDVCKIPKGLDPDDFVREYAEDIKQSSAEELLKAETSNGFGFLLEHMVKGSPVEISKGVKELSKMLARLKDENLKDLFVQWLAKHSKVSKTTINANIKEFESKKSNKRSVGDMVMANYMWPKGCEKRKQELLPFVDKYKMFMGNNRIYKLNDDEFTFRSISNFEIEIIQHMNDDKFPKKLVRIKNTKNQEKIFDTESQNFNSLLAFKNAVTAHGNYKFKGSNNDLDQLTDLLYDEMGVGRKIDVLGWQPDANAWVWNNGVTIPGEGTMSMDDNGVFSHGDVTYYVPSANEIYKNSMWQYQSQKKFVLQGDDITFESYFKLLQTVHRGHAISGSLFALASCFQDIVVDKFHFFPLLFLYGPASSGKSQLAMACQGLFGKPQAQINLEQSLSTGKATMREFAQFSNSIGVLNEYKNGDKMIDGMLKSFWDRQGYKRGTLDSKVSNEEVPMLSSVIVTGNYYPTSEIVVSRLLVEEMVKDNFTTQDKQNFEKLEDVLKTGVSRITQEVLHQRSNFDEGFTREFRLAKEYLSKMEPLKGMKDRYFQNAAVLAATYEVLSKRFSFSFSKIEMMNHFETILLAQKQKVQFSSTITRFWDVFLVAIRGSESTRLRARQDYKLEGNLLFIRYTEVYNRIQTEWWQRFQEACPGKMELRRDLKDSDAYAGYKSSVAYDSGRGAMNSSADIIDISKLDNYDELKFALRIQLEQQDEIDFGANSNIENNDKKRHPHLPF